MSVVPVAQATIENYILAALPSEAYKRLLPHISQVELTSGQMVYEAGAEIKHVYFPESAVFSMLYMMQNGDTAEVGPVGNEGMVGINVFLGATVSSNLVLVHLAGTAMRLRAEVLSEELRRENQLARLLLRYTQLLLFMVSQTSVCRQHHRQDQQFARWLLLMHDYIGADALRLTHELIAMTLGTRRSSISIAAKDFQDAGLIRYGRGHIEVVDRRALEARACECYGVIRAEYQRLYAACARND